MPEELTPYAAFGPPGDPYKSAEYIEKMEQRMAALEARLARLEQAHFSATYVDEDGYA
jgi:hypothetical protein